MKSEDVLAKFNLSANAPLPIKISLPHWTPGNSLNQDRRDFAKWLAEWGLTRGAEIGTFVGEFASVLLEAGLTLTCVDAWKVYPGYPDYKHQRTLDRAYATACETLAPHYGRCSIIKKTSLEAASDIQDGSLDFVFIDANHQLFPVLQDIYAWEPKVRSGGIVSGHDYSPSKNHQVIEAVNAYTSANRIRPWFAFGAEGDPAWSWFWVKP